MKVFKDYLIYSVVSPWDRRKIDENYTYNLVMFLEGRTGWICELKQRKCVDLLFWRLLIRVISRVQWDVGCSKEYLTKNRPNITTCCILKWSCDLPNILYIFFMRYWLVLHIFNYFKVCYRVLHKVTSDRFLFCLWFPCSRYCHYRIWVLPNLIIYCTANKMFQLVLKMCSGSLFGYLTKQTQQIRTSVKKKLLGYYRTLQSWKLELSREKTEKLRG